MMRVENIKLPRDKGQLIHSKTAESSSVSHYPPMSLHDTKRHSEVLVGIHMQGWYLTCMLCSEGRYYPLHSKPFCYKHSLKDNLGKKSSQYPTHQTPETWDLEKGFPNSRPSVFNNCLKRQRVVFKRKGEPTQRNTGAVLLMLWLSWWHFPCQPFP